MFIWAAVTQAPVLPAEIQQSSRSSPPLGPPSRESMRNRALALRSHRFHGRLAHPDGFLAGEDLESVVVDAAFDQGFTDRRLVPGEDESIVGFELIERIEATLENFVGGVVTARHVDAYAHGGSVSVPNLSRVEDSIAERSGRRLGGLHLEAGANVAAFPTGGVRTLGAAAVRAEDGVGPLDRIMGSTTSGTTGGLSE